MIPYAREAGGLVVLALLVAAGVWVYRLGGANARADCAEERAGAIAAAQAETERWQERAYRAEEALGQALKAAPKAGPTIREVVREIPSDCPVPAADRLRDAIRAGNAALAG